MTGIIHNFPGMEFTFPRAFGQNEARENLRQALAQGRFPHALLIHGEAGLGQHALLLDLAQILSCESTRARPCGKCYSCKAFQKSSLESVHYLVPLLKKEKKKKERENEREKENEKADETGYDDDSLNSDQMDELSDLIRLWHEQPYGFGVSEKAMVRVPQTRELLGRLRYASERGKARIVLVPYLEGLNPEAANALLKTLEEPAPDVYFLIASDNRISLLPTLLSRCMQIGLSTLASTELRETAAALSGRVGKPLSERLLPFAEGSPGVYLDLLEHGGEELLEASAKFLSSATAPDWRVFADYSAEAEGLEETARLLHFLLRCARVHQMLKTRHPGPMLGNKDGYRWTSHALRAEGWDASLSGHLGPLEDVKDVPGFVAYLQSAYQAVKDYSLPKIALLGLFLEYEAGVHRT
jgi:DNA polymerase III delta prime subunit